VTTTRFRRLALSCLSAALAWLTTYPFEFWPLALVCWVPFVIAISRVGMREAIALGAANGALLNALAFHWLVDALVRGAGVSLGQALLLFGMFVVVQGGRTIVLVLLYQAGRRGALGVPVAFTMALVIAELVYPMVFPWQSAVFVQPIALWMQTAELGGTLAVSSWIALANGMLASACLARLEASVAQAWRSVIGTAALVGLVSAYGHARMRLLENRLAASERVRAGVVQGYFASPTLPWEAVANYRKETMDLLRRERQVDLVIWPETAIRAPIPEADLPETLRAQVFGHGNSEDESINVPMLVGLVLEQSGATSAGPHGGQERPLTNSAVLGNEDGKVAGRYDKRELVPIGERRVLDWPLAAAILPTVARFHTGEQRPPPRLQGHPLGLSICYEDILPRSFRDSVSRSDPHLLISLTSDRWFNSPGPALHLALASFRAVEHRRYLVRATTTGRTAVVEPSGRVIWQLPEATLASGVVEVRWVQGRSLYSALGDWPWIILSACYGVALTWRPRRTAVSQS
jgi:apolipoprotein N-acyltransferase